jgi:hypothetical protein
MPVWFGSCEDVISECAFDKLSETTGLSVNWDNEESTDCLVDLLSVVDLVEDDKAIVITKI